MMRLWERFTPERAGPNGTCVVFGDFDGMHPGHMAAVSVMLITAAQKGLTPVVASFDRDQEGDERILTCENEKLHLLRQRGHKAGLFLSLPPCEVDEGFIAEALVGRLGARAVVAGANHDKLGLLRECGKKHGFEVVACDVATAGGDPIESGRIRDLILACDFEAAGLLMCHPHIVLGEVVKGKQLGRTIGLPTANIDFPKNKLLPPDGVYVTVTDLDGERRAGLSNIGLRPTVDNFAYRTVEAHILDYSGDIYGRELLLEIHKFIRGIRKFGGLDEVRAQVAKDLEAARGFIETLTAGFIPD